MCLPCSSTLFQTRVRESGWRGNDAQLANFRRIYRLRYDQSRPSAHTPTRQRTQAPIGYMHVYHNRRNNTCQIIFEHSQIFSIWGKHWVLGLQVGRPTEHRHAGGEWSKHLQVFTNSLAAASMKRPRKRVSRARHASSTEQRRGPFRLSDPCRSGVDRREFEALPKFRA